MDVDGERHFHRCRIITGVINPTKRTGKTGRSRSPMGRPWDAQLVALYPQLLEADRVMHWTQIVLAVVLTNTILNIASYKRSRLRKPTCRRFTAQPTPHTVPGPNATCPDSLAGAAAIAPDEPSSLLPNAPSPRPRGRRRHDLQSSQPPSSEASGAFPDPFSPSPRRKLWRRGQAVSLGIDAS